MTPVDTLYRDLSDAARTLSGYGEFSLSISLESNHRKTLILGAASYFEWRLTRHVEAFVDEVTSKDKLVCSLVQAKAISRQFHTWFDWKGLKAGPFFSLFGPEFKEHMKSRLSTNAELVEAVESFLKIGSQRNLLVHSDYASYPIDMTPDEIYIEYKKANFFVESVGDDLRACSKNLRTSTIIG
jgi:RiboL-PSP-HEPN